MFEQVQVKCKQCDGEMKKTTKANSNMGLQLLGVILFLIGAGLLFVGLVPPNAGLLLFGVVLMVSSLNLGYSKKKIWKCLKCGYFFEIV